MRILVVDDEPDLRRLYEENLRDAGHEVVAAANGAEALRLVARESPDLVLVDLLMPVMDGYEFLRELRSIPGNQELPAIVLSALATGGYSRKLGATGFVAKPFDADQLISLVERYAP